LIHARGSVTRLKYSKRQVKKYLKSIIQQNLKGFILLYHISFFIFLKVCYMLRISFIPWAGLILNCYDSYDLPHENASGLEASLAKSKRSLRRPASGIASNCHRPAGRQESRKRQASLEGRRSSNRVYCDLMYMVLRGCYCI
jgi:hypothetical protein